MSKKKISAGKTREQSSAWKGGKWIDGLGYVHVYQPDHPHAHSNGYILEHRLVMEKHIGRYLFPDETVHHKSGIRADNRIGNLELRVRLHPRGGKVEDMIKWANEILVRYAR